MGGNMNKLMKYTQIFITDMKDQVVQKSLSKVGILLHTLTVFQIGILFWVVVVISEI